MINKILKSIFVITVLTLCSVSAQAVESIGSISAVSGDAFAINEDGSRMDLVLKSPIFQNQTVVTGKDGKVQIIFSDSSIFTISANTELLIDEYVYDPKTEQGKSIMNATRGVFKFMTGKIAKNNREEVKVKTPFATIGVRGSGGIIAVDPTLGTKVGLTQCCLDVTTPGGTTPMPLNQMGTFIDVQDPSQPAPQPKPVDAEFSRVIQENFGGDFGQDDGTGNPVQPNEPQASADGEGENQREANAEDEEKDKPQQRRAERRQQRQERLETRLEQGLLEPAPDGQEPAPLEPLASGEPDPTLQPPEGGELLEPLDAPLTAEFSEPLAPEGEPILLDPLPLEPITTDVNLTDVNQEQTDTTATGGTTSGTTGPTHFGKFVRKATGSAGALVEGAISGQFLSDGKFAARIEDQGNVFNVLLPIDSNGFGTRPAITLGGEEFNVRFFKQPNSEFFVINLEAITGSDNIAIFAGEPYSGNLPTSGIATYGFVPNFTNGDTQVPRNSFEGAMYNDFLSRNFIGGNLATSIDGNGNVVIDGFGAVFGDIGANGQSGTFGGYNTDASGHTMDFGTTQSEAYYGTYGAPSGIVMDTNNVTGGGSLDTFARRPSTGAGADAKDAAFVTKAIADRDQTRNYKGFIGGFMSVDADGDGNREYRRITNSISGAAGSQVIDRGIEITVNTATDGSNGVDAKLSGFLDDGEESAMAYDTTQEIIKAEFGGTVNSVAGHLTAYGAEQESSAVDAGLIAVGDAMGDQVNILGNNLTGGEASLLGGTTDAFGKSVAVSGDWMIVGSPAADDGGFTDQGNVQFYKRNQDGTWTDFGVPVTSAPITEAGGQFGYDVAIEGDWAFVGAKFEDSGGTNRGALHVYHLNGSTWTYQQTIPGTVDNGLMGRNIEVNGHFMTTSTATGGVAVFRDNGGTWVPQGMSFSVGGAHDSVAVSEDGRFVAVGQSGENSGMGRVLVYELNTGTGNFAVHKTINGDATSDGLGASIDIKDGKILIGAPVDDRAFIFDLADASNSIGQELVMIDGGGSNGLGEEVAFNGDRVVLGNSTYNSSGTGGAFKVFTLAENYESVIAESNLFIGGGAPSTTTSLASDLDVADMVISHDNQGVLVSDFVSDYRCDNCDYVHWGIWAGALQNDGLVSAGDLAKAEAVYYVAGEMTTPAQLGAQTATNVDFNGMTAGAIDSNGTLSHHIGDFGANVNFATRNVNVTTFTLGDYALTSGGANWTAGDTAFTGSLGITDGTETLNGDMNGAFFGAAATDIGGNYSLENSGETVKASGIYLGTSTP